MHVFFVFSLIILKRTNCECNLEVDDHDPVIVQGIVTDKTID